MTASLELPVTQGSGSEPDLAAASSPGKTDGELEGKLGMMRTSYSLLRTNALKWGEIVPVTSRINVAAEMLDEV